LPAPLCGSWVQAGPICSSEHCSQDCSSVPRCACFAHPSVRFELLPRIQSQVRRAPPRACAAHGPRCSMLVPVMDIRIVRMRVSERRVDVQVSVRFGAIPIGFMAMLVVGVVNVRMRVLQALVQMQMLVHF